MFGGMNQAWVSARYFGWSGASICTRLRTRCGLPPIMARTAASASLVVITVALSPLWNRAFWRLISRMSAWRVATQKGSNPSISARPNGLLARSQA